MESVIFNERANSYIKYHVLNKYKIKTLKCRVLPMSNRQRLKLFIFNESSNKT